MSGFDNRGDNFEKKFAFEEKQSFDVEARCSKLYGLWAAEKLGLEGADADTYAMTIVEANLEEPGFDDVLRAVQKDFDAKGVNISSEEMKAHLDHALQEAMQQLADE